MTRLMTRSAEKATLGSRMTRGAIALACAAAIAACSHVKEEDKQVELQRHAPLSLSLSQAPFTHASHRPLTRHASFHSGHRATTVPCSLPYLT